MIMKNKDSNNSLSSWTDQQQKKLTALKSEMNRAYKRALKNPNKNAKSLFGRSMEKDMLTAFDNLKSTINLIHILEHGFPVEEKELEPEILIYDIPVVKEIPVDEDGFTPFEIL